MKYLTLLCFSISSLQLSAEQANEQDLLRFQQIFSGVEYVTYNDTLIANKDELMELSQSKNEKAKFSAINMLTQIDADETLKTFLISLFEKEDSKVNTVLLKWLLKNQFFDEIIREKILAIEEIQSATTFQLICKMFESQSTIDLNELLLNGLDSESVDIRICSLNALKSNNVSISNLSLS